MKYQKRNRLLTKTISTQLHQWTLYIKIHAGALILCSFSCTDFFLQRFHYFMMNVLCSFMKKEREKKIKYTILTGNDQSDDVWCYWYWHKSSKNENEDDGQKKHTQRKLIAELGGDLFCCRFRSNRCVCVYLSIFSIFSPIRFIYFVWFCDSYQSTGCFLHVL